MRYGLLILGTTAFMIANVYHDGKYVAILKSWKKYYQMAFIGFLGLSAYLFIKKNPKQSSSLLVHANDLIKYMPIDRNTTDFLTPLFTMANKQQTYTEDQNFMPEYAQPILNPQERRILTSGKGTKRSVSETKKKFVASQQGWKCGNCSKQLTAWFEVDHKIRLEHGGSNEVSNLVALCRECHGEKTTMENL
jgi:hypothetical protein